MTKEGVSKPQQNVIDTIKTNTFLLPFNIWTSYSIEIFTFLNQEGGRAIVV